MKYFLVEVGSWFSRGLNVITGDTADVTFSARCHRDGLWAETVIDWIFYHIFQEVNHCRRWWVREYERSLKVVQDFEETVE